jgi:FkbH-like protein
VNFLEARRLVAEFAGGAELPFLLALSGTPDPFRLYLQAAGAKRGLATRPRFLQFNTLHQHLASAPSGEAEAFLLLPSDLVPEADWRSGLPVGRTNVEDALGHAQRVAAQLRGRPHARVLYLPGAIPPITGTPSGEHELRRGLESIALGLGATLVPAEAFSLGAYFASGCPVGGAWLGHVADLAVEALTSTPKPTAKVLVTDLDKTLWSGVIAEDGAEAIEYRPEGGGYRHYVYQTLLARLRREGVLLAAVSRNDPAVIRPPLASGQMALSEEDFVAVIASYHPKSAQIRQLAGELNLGLDAFVFVDDNPVEREEVQQALPEVRCLSFPTHDEELPALLDQLAALFQRRELTDEDRERTAMYRRRLEGMAPSATEGADLTTFLATLGMRLILHDRTEGERTRAVQLINKTNQFNANGRRWTEGEIAELLGRGGRLFGATLEDRSGSHGEIISCLIGPDGVIEAFVMSCRVFQRRVEYAFLAALAARGTIPAAVRFTVTERNEPFARFVEDPAFGPVAADLRPFDAEAFVRAHAGALELVAVTWD